MKRRLTSILSFLLIMSFLLQGCASAAGDGKNSGSLTKAEWIGLLGDKFGYTDYENGDDFFEDVKPEDAYYKEIQACAEWEILPEEGKFEPDEKIDWQYAIETTVRAIGIEKLNRSENGLTVSEENLVDFFVTEIAQVPDSSLDKKISTENAIQILDYAYDYGTNLRLEERFDYSYNEGVSEVNADAVTLTGDGITAKINDGSSYKEGDVIYVKPSENESAYAIKVNSVNGDMINYTLAGMEDVYEELQIAGTFDAQIISVIPAEGITIEEPVVAEEPEEETDEETSSKGNPLSNYVTGCIGYSNGMSGKGTELAKVEVDEDDYKVSAGKDGIRMSATPKSGVTLSIDITNIQVTTDIDYGLVKGLKKADAQVSFTDKVQAKYSRSEHEAEQLNLGTVKLAIGPTPITVDFYILLNFGADGEISLTYQSAVVGRVNYAKGKGLSKTVNVQDPSFDFHAQVTVTVEPAIKVELSCLGVAITNIKVVSGVVGAATVDIDLLGDEPTCIDLKLWVPLRWAVNEDWCLIAAAGDLAKANLRISNVVWGEENSPIQEHFHWEDYVLVEACTRGKEKVETVVEEEEGEYFEYKHFDFKEIVFGMIKVSSSTIHLQQGESMKIGVLSVPGNFNAGDLQYMVDNITICTVDRSGVVRALQPGTAMVRILTPDGMFSSHVSVVVDIPYNDTSGFVPLQ